MDWQKWYQDYNESRIRLVISELKEYMELHELNIEDCEESFIEQYIAVHEKALELNID